MNKVIRIQNVPESLHHRMKARAAMEGITMSRFAVQVIERALGRPGRTELLETITAQPEIELNPTPAEILREAEQMVVEFEPDDKKYLAWCREHPDWFVLTSSRSLYPSHTVIHRASCEKITRLMGNAKPGGFTEREYIKVGSTSVDNLRRWVFEIRPDASARECKFCNHPH